MNRFRQTICLNMIVKNESPVIQRCLDSVRPIIDYWVIVDTGSTDGTQEIIRRSLSDVAGELHERPWVDFAHNRNEALDYAQGKADYVLVMDADETLEIEPGFELPHLTEDCYNLLVRFKNVCYLRKQLVSNRPGWRYVGVLHESIHCEDAKPGVFMKGICSVPHADGVRARDAATFRNDALILEQALLREPHNARYVFYLAQSYRDAKDLENAIRNYRRRIALGGWSEEVWFSKYQIARLRERLRHPWEEVRQDYLDAFQFNPARAEPLYRMGMHYQALDDYAPAHEFFVRGLSVPFPSISSLFIEEAVYTYKLQLEYAVACYYLGQHQEAVRINDQLLKEEKLPKALVERVTKNREESFKGLDALGRVSPPLEERWASRDGGRGGRRDET